jgi:RNA polymerase sigma-70 factor (ECF subfamily)
MTVAVPALRPALGGWAWDWAVLAAPDGRADATWSLGEAELVAEAGRGSAEAFAQLVARHQQALRAFLRRACRDWALADDLAQETFLTAWTRIGRLDPDANVRAWLCGIGYNKCLTALRSDRRARRREADYDKAASIAAAPAPEDRMALERAMADLPLEQRACVALCLAGEFSHAEAADALKLPLGTVKSHVTRGRARLLQALGVSDDQA